MDFLRSWKTNGLEWMDQQNGFHAHRYYSSGFPFGIPKKYTVLAILVQNIDAILWSQILRAGWEPKCWIIHRENLKTAMIFFKLPRTPTLKFRNIKCSIKILINTFITHRNNCMSIIIVSFYNKCFIFRVCITYQYYEKTTKNNTVNFILWHRRVLTFHLVQQIAQLMQK